MQLANTSVQGYDKQGAKRIPFWTNSVGQVVDHLRKMIGRPMEIAC
jgi:hypothetical protein